jgi:hypothetical protein
MCQGERPLSPPHAPDTETVVGTTQEATPATVAANGAVPATRRRGYETLTRGGVAP